MTTRLLNDGDTHGYIEGDILIRTQNGLVIKGDNTHAKIGQNGKIDSIFKKEEVKPKRKAKAKKEEK